MDISIAKDRFDLDFHAMVRNYVIHAQDMKPGYEKRFNSFGLSTQLNILKPEEAGQVSAFSERLRPGDIIVISHSKMTTGAGAYDIQSYTTYSDAGIIGKGGLHFIIENDEEYCRLGAAIDLEGNFSIHQKNGVAELGISIDNTEKITGDLDLASYSKNRWYFHGGKNDYKVDNSISARILPQKNYRRGILHILMAERGKVIPR